MSGVFTEASTAKGNLAATLAAGVEGISQSQTVVFTKYVKVILPLDGYVYWLNSSLVASTSSTELYTLPLFFGIGSLPGQMPLNVVTPNDPVDRSNSRTVTVETPPLGQGAIPNLSAVGQLMPNQPYVGGIATTITVQGSLHVSIDRQQEEDNTNDINHVVFTSLTAVPELDLIGPNTLWIGSYTAGQGEEGTIRFAFRNRSNYYQQADLWHYFGDAIYPDMETQIIDAVGQFDTQNVVVSNSLPLWLSMDQMNPPFPFPARQQIALWPSFLVPPDVRPPYAVVHIQPGGTQAIQAAPIYTATDSQFQLVTEKVKVTLYGLRNFNALDFVQYVQFIAAQDNPSFGIMNIPVVQDEKTTQKELAVIGMKKTVEFEINYYQSRMRNIAQQLIKRVVPQYFIGD